MRKVCLQGHSTVSNTKMKYVFGSFFLPPFWPSFCSAVWKQVVSEDESIQHLWLQEILAGSLFIFYLTFINHGLEEQPLVIMGTLPFCGHQHWGWWNFQLQDDHPGGQALNVPPFEDYSKRWPSNPHIMHTHKGKKIYTCNDMAVFCPWNGFKVNKTRLASDIKLPI